LELSYYEEEIGIEKKDMRTIIKVPTYKSIIAEKIGFVNEGWRIHGLDKAHYGNLGSVIAELIFGIDRKRNN
jgi:hypothetical protein